MLASFERRPGNNCVGMRGFVLKIVQMDIYVHICYINVIILFRLCTKIGGVRGGAILLLTKMCLQCTSQYQLLTAISMAKAWVERHLSYTLKLCFLFDVRRS